MKGVDREEREQWLKAFLPLYEKSADLIQKIAKIGADGLPTDVETLIEGYEKLPPILQSVKEIPKPKEKELRKLKKDFETILDACIKASEWAVKLTRAYFKGDPTRIKFSALVFWTNVASNLMESFSKRLAALSEKKTG